MPLNMKFVFFFIKDGAWETFYLPHYSEKILLLADLKMFTTLYLGVPVNFLWSIFCNLSPIHSDLRCQQMVSKFNIQVTGLFRSLTWVWAAVIVLDLTLISESLCVCGSEWGRRVSKSVCVRSERCEDSICGWDPHMYVWFLCVWLQLFRMTPIVHTLLSLHVSTLEPDLHASLSTDKHTHTHIHPNTEGQCWRLCFIFNCELYVMCYE